MIGAHVFVCFPSNNEHCSQVSPCFISLILCISSFPTPFILPVILLFSIPLALLLFLCPQAHIFCLFPTCWIIVAPCTLLPPSHVCHSLFSVTIQQLCPDFSEALGSKILYLPGQTQNQYPSNTNTAHRQFSRSANDAGSYPATEFSDYGAEMAKINKSSFGCIKSIINALQCCTWPHSIHLLLQGYMTWGYVIQTLVL